MRMKSMADDGARNAMLVLKLIENPTKLLSTILIGNNIVNLSASSLATTFAIGLAKKTGLTDMESIITGTATGLLTILVIIFGEILPKSFASMNSEKISLIYAKPVYMLTNILYPLSFLFDKFSKGLLKLFHVNNTERPAITENELRTILDLSHEEGVIETVERKMITNVVDFGDSLAKDVMIPKMDVEFASVDLSYDELIGCYYKEKYSRMPVYNDSRDDILGVVNLKDVFFYHGSKEDFHITDVMREAYFTYEYKKISELFFEMKRDSITMAIVLDEYGATSGILTMEDLIEEIVGDIRDEYDINEEDDITQLDNENYILLGYAKLDDIDETLGIKIDSEDYDSIAGHIINLLGHFPCAGESVTDEFAMYTVIEASKNRIDKVKLHLLPKEKDEDTEEKCKNREEDTEKSITPHL